MTTANDCIEWGKARNAAGYGVVGTSKVKSRLAHRVAWEKVYGPIPNGLHCLHKCDNPACINAEHLFLGTPADNCADKISKGRGRYGLPAHMNRGENQGASKLKELDVLLIRASTVPQTVTAKAFGIRQQTVSDIKRGRRWAWL